MAKSLKKKSWESTAHVRQLRLMEQECKEIRAEKGLLGKSAMDVITNKIAGRSQGGQTWTD